VQQQRSWTPLALPKPKRDCSRGPVPTGPLHFIREKNLTQRRAGTEGGGIGFDQSIIAHTLHDDHHKTTEHHGDRAHVGGGRTGQTSRKLHLLGLDLRWQQDGDWVCHCKQYSSAATSTLLTRRQNAGMKRPLPHTRILCSLSFALSLSLSLSLLEWHVARRDRHVELGLHLGLDLLGQRGGGLFGRRRQSRQGLRQARVRLPSRCLDGQHCRRVRCLERSLHAALWGHCRLHIPSLDRRCIFHLAYDYHTNRPDLHRGQNLVSHAGPTSSGRLFLPNRSHGHFRVPARYGPRGGAEVHDKM
jgi:hypothetical protein